MHWLYITNKWYHQLTLYAPLISSTSPIQAKQINCKHFLRLPSLQIHNSQLQPFNPNHHPPIRFWYLHTYRPLLGRTAKTKKLRRKLLPERRYSNDLSQRRAQMLFQRTNEEIHQNTHHHRRRRQQQQQQEEQLLLSTSQFGWLPSTTIVPQLQISISHPFFLARLGLTVRSSWSLRATAP